MLDYSGRWWGRGGGKGEGEVEGFYLYVFN